MSSAKGCNYCYDVSRDLTLQIPLNCRTLYVNTAAENTKRESNRVKELLHKTLISVLVRTVYQMLY